MDDPDDSPDQAERPATDLGIAGIGPGVLLGRGGFGTVYRAVEPELHRTVAVKVLTTVSGDETDRVGRELIALGSLSGHPYIVNVHRTGRTASGNPFIVMELMEGGSLGDRIRSAGPMPWTDVVHVGIVIASALESAHRRGILHRDLKPENVLMSGLGEYKLADFGIARVEGAEQTASGMITASMSYAAPEILAAAPPTRVSDVYGLGGTLFALAAGRPPFDRDGDTSLVPMIVRINTEAPPDLRPTGVPEPLCEVLERALAKDPGSRYSSALELARALQRIQRSAGVAVTPLMVAGESPSPASTHPPDRPADRIDAPDPPTTRPPSFAPPPSSPAVPPAWEVTDPAGAQRTAGRRRAKTVGIAIWAVVV
ncbi:MAG: serine/threonine-protein kinase, partial [Ilumatobacteraceae bacterium]